MQGTRRHRLLPLALLCCAVLGVFIGCGRPATNVETGNRNQELYFGIGVEPAALDPHITTGLAEFHVLNALFEGLTTLNACTMAVQPGVAQSWEISEDGLSYTFHIDPNARWSNGDPITAEHFLFSIERILTPELAAPYAYMLYDVKNAEDFNKAKLDTFEEVGVSAPDSATLQIRLEQPTPYFLSLLAHNTWFPVHPPTINQHGGMAERISKWTKAGNIVTNGPFTLKRWRLNDGVYTKRNPYYRDAAKVKLNAVNFMPYNISTEERAFRSNQLHITDVIPTHRIEWYQENRPEVVHFATALGVYYYMLNTEHEALKDVRVRKALAYSINREQITEHILKAGQQPAYHFTPPNTGGYLAEARFPYDPELARQLLAEAGYPGGKGFPTFELLYNTSEEHGSIAVTIQQMWKTELGINIELHNQEWKAYLSTREAGDFDILRAAWFGDYDDPNTFLSLGMTENGNNHTNWGSAAYDQLLEDAAAEQDLEARKELFQQAEALLLEEMPFLPIYFYVTRRLIHPSVKGWHPSILDIHPYQEIELIAD